MRAQQLYKTFENLGKLHSGEGIKPEQFLQNLFNLVNIEGGNFVNELMNFLIVSFEETGLLNIYKFIYLLWDHFSTTTTLLSNIINPDLPFSDLSNSKKEWLKNTVNVLNKFYKVIVKEINSTKEKKRFLL